MATQQETEAFLRGWRAAMEDVLSVLATEAHEWEEEEQEATASGEYKLPGAFALEEVSSSFKGRHDFWHGLPIMGLQLHRKITRLSFRPGRPGREPCQRRRPGVAGAGPPG